MDEATSNSGAAPQARIRVTEVRGPIVVRSETERVAFARQLADWASVEFDAILVRLQEGVLQYEPLSLLSHLSFLNLFGFGTRPSRTPGGGPLQQFHVELVQALVLQHAADDFPWFPTFPNLDRFLGDLEAAAALFVLRRLGAAVEEPERSKAEIREQMRMATQAVRNWGYPNQIERIVTEFFMPIDARVEERIGVRPTALFQMFLGIIAATESRMSEQVRLLAPVARAKSAKKMFEAHARAYPDQPELATELERLWNGLYPAGTPAQTRDLLLQQLNLRLADAFAFSVDDLLALYGAPVDRAAFDNVLGRLSIPFGGLAAADPEHFFLGNPAWRRPLIALEDGRFFVPIPNLLLGFGLEILEALVMGEPALRDAYTYRRGAYLEEATTKLFREAFPDAKVLLGSQWPRRGKFENDLLVVVDRVAIIVEAKAGAVSDATRRGGDMSLRSDVRELMVRASQQSAAFEAYLRANPRRHRFETESGAVNEVDTRPIKEFIRLNVTLSQLGSVYNRWPLVRDAGLVPDGVEMASTMTLADLDSVFEVLDSPCQKLHYLLRRGELERHTAYSGGELDLLALYLETGFNIDRLEFESPLLWLHGKAKVLEPYFMRNETKRSLAKPRPLLSRWWIDLLEQTERIKPFGWTRIGVALLTVPYEDQVRFERRFRGTMHVVRNFWKNEGHVDLISMDTGPDQRQLAVAAQAYRNQREVEAREVISQVFDSVKADKVLFVGVNVEDGLRAWDELVVAFRTPEASITDVNQLEAENRE